MIAYHPGYKLGVRLQFDAIVRHSTLTPTIVGKACAFKGYVTLDPAAVLWELIASLRSHIDEHFADDAALNGSMGIRGVGEFKAMKRQA